MMYKRIAKFLSPIAGRLLKMMREHYYLASGLLIFLSFPSYDAWFFKGFVFFAWFSLIPLFVAVKGKGFKEILLMGFTTGLLGNYLTYHWIGAFGAKVSGGYLVVLSFLIPALSVFFVTRLLLAEYISRKFEGLRFLIYPSVWVFMDMVQTIGFLAFPWTFIGYSQYPFLPFIQISSYVGIMGVNFLMILANYVMADFIYSYRRNSYSKISILRMPPFVRLAGTIFLLLIITLWGGITMIQNPPSSRSDLKVSVIQSCISPWKSWESNKMLYLDKLLQLTDASMNEKPDFVVWSESATLEHIYYDYHYASLNPFEKRVLNMAQSTGTPLLTGEIGIIEDYFRKDYYPQNSAVLINGDGIPVTTYPKIHIVPFGEWFPYEKWFPFVKELITRFGATSFVPGIVPVTFEAKNRKFGVLICYEGIFFRLCRKYRNLGADYLVNITNDGWTDSYSGHMQHFSASVFRAVENGLWYVRAGNTGFSTLIDPYGRIRRSIPILKEGYLTGGMDFSQNHRTFYTRYGDVIFYLVLVFTLALLCWAPFKGRSDE